MSNLDSGEFPLIDSLPALIWVSGTDHAGTYFNRTWLEFTGRTLEQERGDGWMQAVHPDDHPVLEKCYAAFQERKPFQIEFRLRRRDGEYRWMLDHGMPRFSPDGAFMGFIGSCLDITDRRLAEERQAVLTAELDHRVRNALASIRAMLRLSVCGAESKEAFADSLEGRINAYAQVHGLLAAQRWDGASMRSLVAAILTPYGEGAAQRIGLTGPDIMLQPAAALSLSLLIHEMATNAAKHGALSVAEGTVRVGWSLGEGLVRLDWEERGGPPVAAPRRRGFGSHLIESLPRDMGGGGRLEFRTAGVKWRAELPLARVLKQGGPFSAAGAFDGRSAGTKTAGGGSLEGARILVVEDDPLIGMELRSLLATAGATVVGPMTNVPEALSAAKEQALDCAVLDVNLRGELVVPVASLLTRNDVPFLLMTGYGQANLPPELHSTPMLQKPVSAGAILGRLAELIETPTPPFRQ